MGTAMSVIRQVQMLCGDPNGRKISKELIVDLINEESPRVMARFPNEVRVTANQEETEASYGITAATIDIKRLAIKRAYLNGNEAREMRSSDMERITQT